MAHSNAFIESYKVSEIKETFQLLGSLGNSIPPLIEIDRDIVIAYIDKEKKSSDDLIMGIYADAFQKVKDYVDIQICQDSEL